VGHRDERGEAELLLAPIEKIVGALERIRPLRTLLNVKVAEALHRRLKPRLAARGLNLDNTLEELRRLAYFRTGAEDANGELLPVSD
jgi:hypothetical protein